MYNSKNKIFNLVFATMFAITFLVACTDEEQYPLEPIIEFNSIVTNGDEAVLTLNFTDGDGNIGLQEFEVDSPYNFNLFLDYYEKQNGKFEKVNLPIPFSYRIPMINKSDRERPLKGEIKVDISPTYFNPFSQYDTLKLDIYILDRKLNKSNTVSTPELVRPQ